MGRNHTAPFQKAGPRAKRQAEMRAMSAMHEACEAHVRAKMAPILRNNAQKAIAGFRRQTGR